jgi:hypothetical protein
MSAATVMAVDSRNPVQRLAPLQPHPPGQAVPQVDFRHKSKILVRAAVGATIRAFAPTTA